MPKKIESESKTIKYNKKKDEYQEKLKKELTPIKYKSGCILCEIKKENKSVDFVNIKKAKDHFTHDGHYYFITPKGVYLSTQGFLVASYLEGISIPIDHSFIEYQTQKIKIHNEITNKDEVHDLKFIKGLKLSSDVVYMILNQKLADMFTRVPLDLPNFLLAILLLASVILGFVNIGMWFT